MEHYFQPIVNDAVKPADKKRTPKAKLKAVKPGQVTVIKSKLVQVKPEQIKPVKPVQIDRQTTKQEKKRRNSTDCPKPAKKSRRMFFLLVFLFLKQCNSNTFEIESVPVSTKF